MGDSIYVAWTDSTAATGGNPNNNHARIQVAYSRNGGSTWSVTTVSPADVTFDAGAKITLEDGFSVSAEPSPPR